MVMTNGRQGETIRFEPLIEGINNEDVWLYQLNAQNSIIAEWEKVENIYTGAVEELTPEQRSEIAKKAAQARWSKV